MSHAQYAILIANCPALNESYCSLPQRTTNMSSNVEQRKAPESISPIPELRILV